MVHDSGRSVEGAETPLPSFEGGVAENVVSGTVEDIHLGLGEDETQQVWQGDEPENWPPRHRRMPIVCSSVSVKRRLQTSMTLVTAQLPL